MIYIGSDHEGYTLKEELKGYLLLRGYKVKDMGADDDSVVDYPQIAKLVAEKVAEEVNSRGILVSASGLGMCIAANKVKKISAAVVYNLELAEKTRLQENTNVLCVPEKYVGIEMSKDIVGTWLSTSFSSIDYYVQCLKEIRQMEEEK